MQRYHSQLIDGNSVNFTVYEAFADAWGFKIYFVAGGRKLRGDQV